MQLLYLEYLAYFIVVGIICLIMGWKLRGALFTSRIYIAQDENEKTIRALKNSENQISTINKLLDNERADHRAEQQKFMQRVERLKGYKDSSNDSDNLLDSLQAQFDAYRERKDNEIDELHQQLKNTRSEPSWQTRQKESTIARFQEQLGQLKTLRIENQAINRKLKEDTAMLKARIRELEAHVYHH